MIKLCLFSLKFDNIEIVLFLAFKKLKFGKDTI